MDLPREKTHLLFVLYKCAITLIVSLFSYHSYTNNVVVSTLYLVSKISIKVKPSRSFLSEFSIGVFYSMKLPLWLHSFTEV